MRILHIDPAPTWRGGERQVFLLARELERRGHESPVAAAPGGKLMARLRGANLPARPLAIRGDLDPAAVWRVSRLLRHVRPDVLHLHTSRAHGAAGLGARLAGYHPVLVTRRLELPVRGVLSRWKYRRLADHYVAISRAVEESLTAGGVAPRKVSLVPSGIELPAEGPTRSRERPWTVGTLAAFTPQKDPTTWALTVEQVCQGDPEVRFVWAGEGELLPRVEVAIERAGLRERVTLPGFLDDPSAFWSGIDVFFLPSAFEALGTTVLDALGHGIPVVATTVGGIPEIVASGREGLLAGAGDVRALADALLTLRRDPTRAAEMGRAGRTRARDFEIGGVVDRIVRVYEKLGSEGSGRC